MSLMLKFSTCVEYGRSGIYFIIKMCMFVESMYRMIQKNENFEKPIKNWRNPRKKIIDRNWSITTCLLRDSNPNYQCLKITSCSAECDGVAFCRACNTHTQGDTKERELLKCVVAVKECIRGGGRHLQDVIFKHW